MKILKRKERGYRFFSEKYDLNGSYAGRRGVPIGLLLLYILATDTEVEFASFNAEAEGELGEPHNMLQESDRKIFSDLDELAELFKGQEFKIWELAGRYRNEEIYITGRTYGTVLSIRTPLTSDINVLPLMEAVESATHNYHNCDSPPA